MSTGQPPDPRLLHLVVSLPTAAVLCWGEQLHCNECVARLVGYQCDELSTKERWFETLFQTRAISSREVYEKHRQSGFSQPWEMVVLHRNGEQRLVEFAAAHFDGDEVWFLRDLTDSARSARLLERMARTARIGGWEIDLATRALYWTEETYHIHGLDSKSGPHSIERAIDYYAPQCRPIIAEAVRSAIELGRPFDLELELIAADGREVHVRAVGFAEREGEVTRRLFGSFQDITGSYRARQEREHIQTQLVQTQKLESLGVLAGGIAHDFNNILAGIVGFAELALVVLPQTSPAVEPLNHVLRTADRAAQLCQQMLAYAGKGRLQMEAIDLNRLIESSVPLLQLSVTKRVRLSFEYGQSLPPVKADYSQVGQVVVNLVINGSEAIGDAEGEIHVRTYAIEQGACLEVSDNGCGMDDATAARIFEPFFSTKFTGRGLGLAAVAGIVRGHGGQIEVHSRLGKGTTFRIELPGSDGPLSSRYSSDEISTWTGTGRVLIVDDESDVRSVVASMVRQLGFTTTEATDGVDGLLRLVNDGPFRLVLLDMTMPRMDGIAALNEITRLYPQTRVVLMSGYTESQVNERLGGGNAVAFLQKPFNLAELRRQLRRTLRDSDSPPAG